jgi:hypothetical protein
MTTDPPPSHSTTAAASALPPRPPWPRALCESSPALRSARASLPAPRRCVAPHATVRVARARPRVPHVSLAARVCLQTVAGCCSRAAPPVPAPAFAHTSCRCSTAPPAARCSPTRREGVLPLPRAPRPECGCRCAPRSQSRPLARCAAPAQNQSRLWQVAPRQRQKRHRLAKNETVSPRPRVTRVRAKVRGSEGLLNETKKANRRLFVFRFFCRFFLLALEGLVFGLRPRAVAG